VGQKVCSWVVGEQRGEKGVRVWGVRSKRGVGVCGHNSLGARLKERSEKGGGPTGPTQKNGGVEEP